MSAPAPAASASVRARHAYPATAAVYAAVFGTASVTWTALLLFNYHVLPVAWMDVILRHQQGADVVPAAFAWLVAAGLFGTVIDARLDTPASAMSRRQRYAAAMGAVTVASLPALWALRNIPLLDSDDLTPRILQLLGSIALAGALAAYLGAPRLAELGIAAPSRGGFTELYGVVRASLLGLIGSTVAAYLIVSELHPRALVGPVGVGSGMVESTWFWLAVTCVNAIVEEGICTAWLYALLHRAGRPRSEIYLVAALARVAFHLWMGLPGLAAAIFALVNIRLFERTRRLAPLILVHACFDCAGLTNNSTLLYVIFGIGAAMLLYPPRFLPRGHASKPQAEPATQATHSGSLR